MVSATSSGWLLLLLVAIAYQETYSDDSLTPIADRRKLTLGKKWIVPPLFRKAKSNGWLPSFTSFFGGSEVEEQPTFHELAPLSQYPIWKVHKYKGIELRPVPVIDTHPRAVDLPVVRAEPPQIIQLPQYGPPVAEYKPAPVEYRVPATEYGVPPAPVSQYQFPPAAKESTNFSEPETPTSEEPKAASEEDTTATPESLDVLSNLGSLTSFLGGGGGGDGDEATGNLARLQFISQLFRSDKNLLTKIKNLKSWKFPAPLKPVPQAPTNAIYYPPKKESKSLFSSFIPSFLRETTERSVPLPVLPEVAEIPVAGIEQVPFQVPELPPIHLPTYTSNHVSGPYVRVKVNTPSPAIPQVAAPTFSEVDFRYPTVPLSEQFYQPLVSYQVPTSPVVAPTPLYNSYGVPIPYDSYSAAASNQEPLIVTPEPSNHQNHQPEPQLQQLQPQQHQQQQALPPQLHIHAHQFPQQPTQQRQVVMQSTENEETKNENMAKSQDQPEMDYELYDGQLDDNVEMMDPRSQ